LTLTLEYGSLGNANAVQYSVCPGQGGFMGAMSLCADGTALTLTTDAACITSFTENCPTPDNSATGLEYGWSGPGIVCNGDGTATFDPVVAGPGEHTITVSTPCGDATTTISVAPDLEISVDVKSCDASIGDELPNPLSDGGAGPFTTGNPGDDVVTADITLTTVGGALPSAGMVTLVDNNGNILNGPFTATVAAGDTEYTFTGVELVGDGVATFDFMITYSDGAGLMCDATLMFDPVGDCSCYDIVCDDEDEVMYQGALTSGDAPGPTGGNITTYVLLNAPGGTIIQESSTAQFDVTGLTLGQPYPYHAINYELTPVGMSMFLFTVS